MSYAYALPLYDQQPDPSPWYAESATRAPSRRPVDRNRPPVVAVRPVHPDAEAALHPKAAEAGSVAGAFSADFLSWNGDDLGRRGRALSQHVAAPAVPEEHLGSAGGLTTGRQRADLVLVGEVKLVSSNPDRFLAHVRVRVTPYRRISGKSTSLHDTTDVLPVPAAAPPPVDPDWLALEGYWYTLVVPVREGDAGLMKVEITKVLVIPPLPAHEVAGTSGEVDSP
jgi:hypothetical protein